MATDELEHLVAALRDPTRRGILLSFYDRPEPRTVDEVAESAEVHRTVAFAHLEKLARLGYLASDRRRGGVGKPAKLYRLAAGPLSLSHPRREFAILARLLADGLEGLGAPGVAAARRAGVAFGRRLAAPAAGVEAALQALIPLGAGHRLAGGERVVAINCIFKEACAHSAGAVCTLHAGIIEGVLQGAGLRYSATPAGAAGAGGCAFSLSGESTLLPNDVR